jgi:hypothetical protein
MEIPFGSHEISVISMNSKLGERLHLSKIQVYKLLGGLEYFFIPYN